MPEIDQRLSKKTRRTKGGGFGDTHLPDASRKKRLELSQGVGKVSKKLNDGKKRGPLFNLTE